MVGGWVGGCAKALFIIFLGQMNNYATLLCAMHIDRSPPMSPFPVLLLFFYKRWVTAMDHLIQGGRGVFGKKINVPAKEHEHYSLFLLRQNCPLPYERDITSVYAVDSKSEIIIELSKVIFCFFLYFAPEDLRVAATYFLCSVKNGGGF